MAIVSIREIAKPALFGLSLMGLATLARHFFIEPEAIAFACDANPWAGWCAPRMLLIQTFAHYGLGWVALGAGALALVTGAALPAYVAWAVGCVGIILYCYEFAAVGALAGALVILRRLVRQR